MELMVVVGGGGGVRAEPFSWNVLVLIVHVCVCKCMTPEKMGRFYRIV